MDVHRRQDVPRQRDDLCLVDRDAALVVDLDAHRWITAAHHVAGTAPTDDAQGLQAERRPTACTRRRCR